MPDLHLEIKPYQVGRLKVSDLHEIHYQLFGNAKGKPVVYLHGGPGSGCNPDTARYFDLEKYMVVIFDQRGCGESSPYCELRENTTQDLVGDIEKLRVHLGVGKWLVAGGSWGSTLALAYAQAFPDRVTEMVMYGIFLGSSAEVSWMYESGGVSKIFPDYWQDFIAVIDPRDRDTILASYQNKFSLANEKQRLEAVRAWTLWEARLLKLIPDEGLDESFSVDNSGLAHALIECHYFTNDCFLRPGQLLAGVSQIAHIPAIIINGRYDMVCPPLQAWELSRLWPNSCLTITQAAGHSRRDIANNEALIEAFETFAPKKAQV